MDPKIWKSSVYHQIGHFIYPSPPARDTAHQTHTSAGVARTERLCLETKMWKAAMRAGQGQHVRDTRAAVRRIPDRQL